MTIEVYENGDAAPSTPGAASPPYSSFASLLRILDSMRDNGLPARLDRSYFGSASGGLVSQTRKTLAFFELIDEEYQPTDSLRSLIEVGDDERKAMLRALAEGRYAEEIKLAEGSGTAGQLLEVMRQRGLTGATGRKAATFYIHLSEYVGLPVSPYFAQARMSGSSSSALARRPRRKKVEPTPIETPLPAAAPNPVVSPEVQKARYVELLMEMAVKSGDADGKPSADLLDRIERMLGHDPVAGSTPNGADEREQT